MDYQRLFYFIKLLIDKSEGETTRYFIQFHSPAEYLRCILLLTLYCKQDPTHEGYEFLPSIRAICCNLTNPDRFNDFNDLVQIEEDQLLQLGTRYQLPTAGKPFDHVDISKRIPWGLRAIHVPKLWPKTKGQGVRIGIVDTGVDYTHPDITSSLKRGVNLLNHRQLPIDDNGHGTHIAGTLASSNVSAGIQGVAPHASLFPVKAFDRDGAAYVSDIILAIHWCISNRMNIINMSFGMSSYSPALHNAVKSAYAQEIVIVASAGNQGKRKSIDYPARFPQTVAVGATNKGNRIAVFSNQGDFVDVYAPGEAIYSTWLHGQYNELSGTSMATAHVSGVLALLLTKKPNLTASRIKTILTTSAISLIHMNKKLSPRRGRLHAVRAWNLMHYNGKRNQKVSTTKAKQ